MKNWFAVFVFGFLAVGNLAHAEVHVTEEEAMHFMRVINEMQYKLNGFAQKLDTAEGVAEYRALARILELHTELLGDFNASRGSFVEHLWKANFWINRNIRLANRSGSSTEEPLFPKVFEVLRNYSDEQIARNSILQAPLIEAAKSIENNSFLETAASAPPSTLTEREITFATLMAAQGLLTVPLALHTQWESTYFPKHDVETIQFFASFLTRTGVKKRLMTLAENNLIARRAWQAVLDITFIPSIHALGVFAGTVDETTEFPISRFQDRDRERPVMVNLIKVIDEASKIRAPGFQTSTPAPATSPIAVLTQEPISVATDRLDSYQVAVAYSEVVYDLAKELRYSAAELRWSDGAPTWLSSQPGLHQLRKALLALEHAALLPTHGTLPHFVQSINPTISSGITEMVDEPTARAYTDQNRSDKYYLAAAASKPNGQKELNDIQKYAYRISDRFMPNWSVINVKSDATLGETEWKTVTTVMAFYLRAVPKMLRRNISQKDVTRHLNNVKKAMIILSQNQTVVDDLARLYESSPESTYSPFSAAIPLQKMISELEDFQTKLFTVQTAVLNDHKGQAKQLIRLVTTGRIKRGVPEEECLWEILDSYIGAIQ